MSAAEANLSRLVALLTPALDDFYEDMHSRCKEAEPTRPIDTMKQVRSATGPTHSPRPQVLAKPQNAFLRERLREKVYEIAGGRKAFEELYTKMMVAKVKEVAAEGAVTTMKVRDSQLFLNDLLMDTAVAAREALMSGYYASGRSMRQDYVSQLSQVVRTLVQSYIPVMISTTPAPPAPPATTPATPAATEPPAPKPETATPATDYSKVNFQ